MSVTDNLAKLQGKWAYVWRPQNLFRGDVQRAVDELKATGTSGVAIKVSNGWYAYDQDALLHQFIMACVANNISVVFWSYIYLNNPTAEAAAAVKMCTKYRDICVAFLIDAEGEAKGKYAQAPIFAAALKKGLEPLGIPIGLNSYRYPSLHPELPWKALRAVCNFDMPQVYYRNTDPITNLERSFAQFQAMSPRLDYQPAGDMYYEFGIKPTPMAVKRFIEFCREDPRFDMVVMWSADQCEVTPELWSAYGQVCWPVAGKPHTEVITAQPLPPPGETPLYAAAVTANILNVRQGPGLTYPVLRQIRQGDRVNVYEVRPGWARISPTEWVSTLWIVKV